MGGLAFLRAFFILGIAVARRDFRITEQETERIEKGAAVDFHPLNLNLLLETIAMIRIGYAPGAYDLFHVGHLHLLRQARAHCDFLIAGVVADDVLIEHKGVKPVVPLAERLEIVRNVRYVDAAYPALTNDKVAIWKNLRFNVLFKGDDWKGTEKGLQLERAFSELGVEIVYFPYGKTTSSSALRRTLKSIDDMASRVHQRRLVLAPAFAP
jgi:glycerol-3-phosphate cytidylyltransferase